MEIPPFRSKESLPQTIDLKCGSEKETSLKRGSRDDACIDLRYKRNCSGVVSKCSLDDSALPFSIFDVAKAEEIARQATDKECTFKPKIKKLRGVPDDAALQNVIERLYANARLSQERKQQSIFVEQKNQDDLIKAECSFKPLLIASKNKTLYDMVNAKYMKPKKQSDYLQYHYDESRSCTFKPKVGYSFLRKIN